MKPLFRDAVPAALFRYFSERQYAEQFLAGSIHLGNRHGYTKTNDHARADELEGRGEFRFPGLVRRVAFFEGGKSRELSPVPGHIHVSSFDGTPTYICCFSTVLSAELAQKWGPFVVRLDDPTTFIERLARAAEGRDDLFGPLECGRVVYDSTPMIAGMPEAEDLHTQASFTKPGKFREEREFRMAQWWKHSRNSIHLDGDDSNPPPFITILLGDRVAAAELIVMEQESDAK